MKAFLLAAGIGTRMRPITDTTPKCMLEIGGQPLLGIWLDELDRAGVDEVLVNLHYLPDVVRGYVAGRSGPPAVRLFAEPELLGSAGTLAANRDWVRGEGFFLACNADNLTDFEVRSLVDAHRQGGAVATLAAFHSPDPSAGGVLETDADGRADRLHREARPARLRPGERRDIRVQPSPAGRDRRPSAQGHRLRPAAPAGGPGQGRAGAGILPRHRHA